eukprot:1215331-Amphidinium_carterae.1
MFASVVGDSFAFPMVLLTFVRVSSPLKECGWEKLLCLGPKGLLSLQFVRLGRSKVLGPDWNGFTWHRHAVADRPFPSRAIL